MTKVDEYAEDILAPRISMVDGVSQVTVQGAARYAVRIQVDPERLEAQKIGFNEVDAALQNWNVTQPTGQLFGPLATYSIVTKGQLNNAGVHGDHRLPRGRPVRLYQVANVLDSIQSLTSARVHHERLPAAITPRSAEAAGTNVIEVTDAVRAVLPAPRRSSRRRCISASGRIARSTSAGPSATSRSRC
jgi:HAE1 family hydrophobic/amphiphilic exporter-1